MLNPSPYSAAVTEKVVQLGLPVAGRDWDASEEMRTPGSVEPLQGGKCFLNSHVSDFLWPSRLLCRQSDYPFLVVGCRLGRGCY